MSQPIFVDATVPIYAAGRAHPLKDASARVLELIARFPEGFITDTLTLQELLERYDALGIRQGTAVVQGFADLLRDRIEPVLAVDVERAAKLLAQEGQPERQSIRHLFHRAVMERLGIDTIVSTDPAYEQIPGLRRLDPAVIAGLILGEPEGGSENPESRSET